jgi:hypothetical protein
MNGLGAEDEDGISDKLLAVAGQEFIEEEDEEAHDCEPMSTDC